MMMNVIGKMMTNDKFFVTDKNKWFTCNDSEYALQWAYDMYESAYKIETDENGLVKKLYLLKDYRN